VPVDLLFFIFRLQYFAWVLDSFCRQIGNLHEHLASVFGSASS